MKLQYDKKVDAVYVELAAGTYKVSRKISDTILVDEDTNGQILGIEILDASKNIPAFDPQKVAISVKSS